MDPAITAAIITVGGGPPLIGLGWLVKRSLGKRDAAKQSAGQHASARRQVIDSLLSAGQECLSALDDRGDMKAAQYVAGDRLSETMENVRKLRDVQLDRIGSELIRGVADRKRETIEVALADLERVR